MNGSDGGVFSNNKKSSVDQHNAEEEDNDVVIKKARSRSNDGLKRRNHVKSESDSEFESEDLSELEKLDNRPFKKVKHTFEI